MSDLGEFEGRTITRTTVALRRAGDGLSKAQKVDPVVLRQGDTVYVVCETTVGSVTFKPIEELEEERRTDLIVQAATIIDSDVVKDALEAHKERLRVIEEAEQGVQGLPLQEVLAREHRAGLHEGEPHGECPECAL